MSEDESPSCISEIARSSRSPSVSISETSTQAPLLVSIKKGFFFRRPGTDNQYHPLDNIIGQWVVKERSHDEIERRKRNILDTFNGPFQVAGVRKSFLVEYYEKDNKIQYVSTAESVSTA